MTDMRKMAVGVAMVLGVGVLELVACQPPTLPTTPAPPASAPTPTPTLCYLRLVDGVVRDLCYPVQPGETAP